MALGLTITFTAAIIFALWASSLSSRTAVAVAGRDIPTGSTVEVDDLRAVEVASGHGAEFVPMGDLDSVIGRTVRSSIPEGAILHPDLLSANSPIDADMAVVGAVLHPGEYPIAHLGPGQPVGVVITSENRDQLTAAGSDLPVLAPLPDASTTTTKATVTEVSEVLDSGRDALFVSLLASADDAVLISNAAAFNTLRLILLPEGFRPAGSLPIHQQATTEAVR